MVFPQNGHARHCIANIGIIDMPPATKDAPMMAISVLHRSVGNPEAIHQIHPPAEVNEQKISRSSKMSIHRR